MLETARREREERSSLAHCRETASLRFSRLSRDLRGRHGRLNLAPRAGLERHEAAFRDNSIDMDVIRELNEHDLEMRGLPLGYRKRVPLANRPSPGAPAASPTAAPHARDEPERRPITVMFCDLVGSTSLASTLEV